MIGTVPLERAYYHCPSCGTGTVPWDEALGLTRQALTPAAREAVCLAGAVDSFGEAAECEKAAARCAKLIFYTTK